MIRIRLTLLSCLLACASCHYPSPQGDGHLSNIYTPTPLPLFDRYQAQLPEPIFDRKPAYIDFYYQAWKIGFAHFKQPHPNSPLVANFIDEAFNENIFLWDMSFSTMWGNYAHDIFPGIKGLDNFYHLQLADGEIVREIGEADGKLGVKGWSEPGTEGSLNHPMLAWAELESYKITADKTRLGLVYEPLIKYRNSFSKIYHPASGLYLTDKGAMDDSPRNDELLCGVDVAAEMVIFDRWLAEIADILGKQRDAKKFTRRADSYAAFINEKLWDDETGFYYDWGKNNQRMTMRTIAAFWPMLGGIPNQQQFQRLLTHLNNPEEFNTPHRVPTHPVNERGFAGNYWDGGVWAPTNTMVIQGLERYHHFALAHEIALNHLDNTTQVFLDTGTAWENYQPLAIKKGMKARPDFIGWSGLAPINYLIQYAIGIRINAPSNEITWRINELGRHGIKNLRYGSNTHRQNTLSLIAEARTHADDDLVINLSCNQPFRLNIVIAGKQVSHSINCQQEQPLIISLANLQAAIADK
jgi:hypothetical protein